MEMDPDTKDYKAFTELIPLLLVLMVVVILSCPFNIMYRSSRLFFLTCLFHCICAPLYKCLRRLFEERDAMQGYNGVKYFLTIVAVCLRTAYSLNKGITWKVLAWIFSICAAIISTYWDLVIDWGLLQKKSKNRSLRDKLIIPHKSVYFTAMVLNILLRFAWLQTVLDFKFNFLHRQAMIGIIASLEIIRRGIWNFFRVENEHLNNVGKFRAFGRRRLCIY